MTSPFVPNLQQSSIAPKSAVTWCFERITVIVVQRGRVWATVDNAALQAGGPRGADWFLDPGMSLRLAAGQRVVLEAVGRHGEAATLGLYAEAVFRRRPGAWMPAWFYRARSNSGVSAIKACSAVSP